MADPTPSPGKAWLDNLSRWFVRHPCWTLTLAMLAALGPFLAKPFNLDDPLFIWAAHQIHLHLTDPYGFTVEWGWTAFPMWKVTENPPLACYYLAGAAGIFGWSELALHFAFLLPALAVILGTHRLARHFCQQLLAALAALFTPVFLVSSLSVMCDVTMLAFWVWTVVFWIEGTEPKNLRKLFVAGWLIALAEMTKYYGACLIPLLAAYSLINKRRVGDWAQFLLIPLVVLCAYQYATQAAYGSSLLYGALDYASFSKDFFAFSKLHSCLTALAFTGGGLAAAAFFAPLLWRAKMLAVLAGGAVLIAITLFLDPSIWGKYPELQAAARTPAKIQFLFWATGGVGVLALALADIRDRPEARSWLLALWVLGTFAFAAFFNWTVNARSLLPMAPAVGILIVRRLEQTVLVNRTTWPRSVVICLIGTAGLSWLATRSDFLLATAVRNSAREVCARYGGRTGTLWFQGHWGFQYYMESFGASALDFKHAALKPGDGLAVPSNNTNQLPPDPKKTALLEKVTVFGPHWLTTWNRAAGAGFYASAIGPVPFVIGRVPPESVSLYVLGPPLEPPRDAK
jgi:4-amino-4-deoxy-L-arabinose transferase-like glycosyltransferase